MRNPVKRMNSVDALDLMTRAYHILRKDDQTDRAFLASLKEQIFLHKRALRFVINGSHEKTDKE